MIRCVLGCLLVATLSACAGLKPGEEPTELPDPLEPINRVTFIGNGIIDRYALIPTARGYKAVTNQDVRDSVRNVYRTSRAPLIFAGDLAQGELKRAGVTLGRTLLNATIGLGGIFDVAGRLGLEHHNEDAGQTLAVYGVPPVAYVELPFFGPSTVRGTGGFAADNVTNPITWGQSTAVMATDQAINFMGGIDIRARNLGRLEDIKRGSVDYYAAIKSLWWQNRRNEIMNGRLDTDALPDFDFEDFEIEPESE